MSDHDAPAALPLTPEEERRLRSIHNPCTYPTCGPTFRGEECTVGRLLATLDAERGVRVTGDAGLREALALLDDALTVQRFPCDHKGIGKPGCAICDPRVYPDARAALTGDTPEPRP